VTTTTISDTTILRPADRCVVREQVDQFLVYNGSTDELHLIPPTGFFVYALCDGLRTVNELQDIVGTALQSDPALLRQRLQDFLSALVDRGVLEVSA
jgi:hypothetical protein